MQQTSYLVFRRLTRHMLTVTGFALAVSLIDLSIARAGEPGSGEAGSWQDARAAEAAKSKAVPAMARAGQSWHDKSAAEWRAYHEKMTEFYIANAGR